MNYVIHRIAVGTSNAMMHCRNVRSPFFSVEFFSMHSPGNLLSSPILLQHNYQHQQTRSFAYPKTKRKLRLEAKRKKKEGLAAKGIFPNKPDKYIPVDTPVVNAYSQEGRREQNKEANQRTTYKLKKRMIEVQSQEPILRHHMEGLKVSDRVRKLFDLTNASQSEVVQAQKQRGMELFQVREGDTGSSSVQVVAITSRIQQLTQHRNTHKKDKSCKRGLDALYIRRRKLLDYMERKDYDSYRAIVKTLGLARRN